MEFYFDELGKNGKRIMEVHGVLSIKGTGKFGILYTKAMKQPI